MNVNSIKGVGEFKVDNVYCKYCLHFDNAPLVYTFSNAGNLTPSDMVLDPSYSPWGYKFLIQKKLNVVSFSCIDSASWYRSDELINCLALLGTEMRKRFSEILGYGGSMGGYAIGAYAELLNIDRVLLLNPISTLDKNLVSWETRFRSASKELNWKDNFNDMNLSKSTGYVIYDNLFKLDSNHAKRYPENITHLKLSGVGHRIPEHLLKIKILKEVFDQFVNDKIDLAQFYKGTKRRRMYIHYYNWMLSSENTHLTTARRKIIQRYRRAALSILGDDNKYYRAQTNVIRDAAILLQNDNPELSTRLFEIALERRPNGHFIRKSLRRLNRKL